MISTTVEMRSMSGSWAPPALKAAAALTFARGFLVRCVYSIRSRGALVFVQESAEGVATLQRYGLRRRPCRSVD
jgi:hypothetical protein